MGGSEAYGLPAHAAAPGMLAHWGSSGLMGVPCCQYGPPSHTGYVGICAHRGSSGSEGTPEPGSPSGTGVREVATKPGIAFAGMLTPFAIAAISAPATTMFVIVLRTPERVIRLIYRSLGADRNGRRCRLLLLIPPHIVACLLITRWRYSYGLKPLMDQIVAAGFNVPA